MSQSLPKIFFNALSIINRFIEKLFQQRDSSASRVPREFEKSVEQSFFMIMLKCSSMLEYQVSFVEMFFYFV